VPARHTTLRALSLEVVEGVGVSDPALALELGELDALVSNAAVTYDANLPGLDLGDMARE
jgi:hypothetical protein